MGPRVQLPEAVAQVFITEELRRRPQPDADYLREKLALQDLAQQMTDHPSEILPRLVKLGMEVCGAESAGISILEPASEQFRWFGLHGVLSAFEGATTPRYDSPCGVCLDNDAPVLMDRPERAYSWIRDAKISVPEVLLVPLKVKGLNSIGTLWIVSKQPGCFDGGHSRILTELASFAGTALRMIQTEEKLTAALLEQETLTKEMSHRVKNLFSITDSMIRMSLRSATTKEELAATLSGRLHALASANALVRRAFGPNEVSGVSFKELLERVLRPYDHLASTITGPDIALGNQATNNIALVFHELATNAAKYGSLSKSEGSVVVQFETTDSWLSLTWIEINGPAAETPSKEGFGSSLVRNTINHLGGTIEYNWLPTGLKVLVRTPVASLNT
jgi:two-component sensor histidine kinase